MVCLGTNRRTPGGVAPIPTPPTTPNVDGDSQSTFRIAPETDERFEERAAILQYDGGFSRQEAEDSCLVILLEDQTMTQIQGKQISNNSIEIKNNFTLI